MFEKCVEKCAGVGEEVGAGRPFSTEPHGLDLIEVLGQ